MYPQSLDQTRELAWRVSGPPEAPVLIYVPGIHGDWTPMWRIRELLNQKLRLVEIAYPRAPEWSLDDYTARLFDLFESQNIASAHLLAESFGSLVGWDFALKHPGRVRSLILAGGFCSTPGRLRVAMAWLFQKLVPSALLDRMIDCYLVFLIRKRLPKDAFSPEDFFPSSRTRRGHQAIARRLEIIKRTDVRKLLGGLRLPILYLGGSLDLVVPVRREIRCLSRNLHENCAFRPVLLKGAPHAIVPARFREVTGLITDWIAEQEAKTPPPSLAAGS